MMLPRSALRPTGAETGSPDVPPTETVSAPPPFTSEDLQLFLQADDLKGRTKISMRVLVIEDDRDAASWLVKGLKESGHLADHAADGEQGLGHGP